MRKLIAKDPDFFDPYLVISDIHFSYGEDDEASTLLLTAYKRALMTIVDEQGRWPQGMPWGFLEKPTYHESNF